MTSLLVLAAALPCVHWTGGIETRPALQAAGVTRICVPPERVNQWRAAGLTATPVTEAELASRESLPVPGTAPRAGLASPTRSPWINASGWRFMRRPDGKYLYTVPAGKAALAAAEAFAYGADAILKIDPSDLGDLGRMLSFLASLPAADLPPVADLAIVDDRSPLTGEVMNLLARRNLLYKVVSAPAAQFPITIRIGTPEYPTEEARDPSAFALKIRRQLTDERRTLRVYGSEVVICVVTADASRARLHLINYGGRDIEGLRIRLRGRYAGGDAQVAGARRLQLADRTVADGATEFSIPRMTTYAVVDLSR